MNRRASLLLLLAACPVWAGKSAPQRLPGPHSRAVVIGASRPSGARVGGVTRPVALHFDARLPSFKPYSSAVSRSADAETLLAPAASPAVLALAAAPASDFRTAPFSSRPPAESRDRRIGRRLTEIAFALTLGAASLWSPPASAFETEGRQRPFQEELAPRASSSASERRIAFERRVAAVEGQLDRIQNRVAVPEFAAVADITDSTARLSDLRQRAARADTGLFVRAWALATQRENFAAFLSELEADAARLESDVESVLRSPIEARQRTQRILEMNAARRLMYERLNRAQERIDALVHRSVGEDMNLDFEYRGGRHRRFDIIGDLSRRSNEAGYMLADQPGMPRDINGHMDLLETDIASAERVLPGRGGDASGDALAVIVLVLLTVVSILIGLFGAPWRRATVARTVDHDVDATTPPRPGANAAGGWSSVALEAPAPAAPVPAPPLDATVKFDLSEAHCLVCGQGFAEGAVLCAVCHTPHHADCWATANGNGKTGCAVYACRGGELKPVAVQKS